MVRRRTRRIGRYAKIVGSIPTGGIDFAFCTRDGMKATFGGNRYECRKRYPMAYSVWGAFTIREGFRILYSRLGVLDVF